MNLRDLRYLVAVAEQKHFGRAAEACFVSQPTLSTQIRKLEDELGVTLIERTHRQVMLTPVGERIVAQAQRVLREVNQMVHIAEEHKDPYGGDFRLGIIPTVAPYLLPKILGPIKKAFPKLRIQLTEAQTAVITRMLREGDLDAVILALPVDEDNLKQVKLYTEPFFFAASRSHPKAKQTSVRLADLDHEQVLLLEDGHCLRDQALAICSSHNAVENTNFRATSIETLRQMVAANVGITLMPELAITARGGQVRYLPFKDDDPHRDIGLCWRASSTRRDLLAEFAQLLKATMKQVMGRKAAA
jgi:LysR family hydrogen peroxide-inducible transcriptional activator